MTYVGEWGEKGRGFRSCEVCCENLRIANGRAVKPIIMEGRGGNRFEKGPQQPTRYEKREYQGGKRKSRVENNGVSSGGVRLPNRGTSRPGKLKKSSGKRNKEGDPLQTVGHGFGQIRFMTTWPPILV